MIRRPLSGVWAAILVAALRTSTVASARTGESFDKPVRETALDLGPSPSQGGLPGSRFRVRLSCFYYPTFMVKELDEDGIKGSWWVTISPIDEGRIPPCREAHDPAEKFLSKDGWLLIGVKGPLSFLAPPDGENGAMYFRVIDSTTRQKIFEDAVLVWKAGRDIPPFEFGAADGKTEIRYRRSVEANCSIPKDGLPCWNQIRTQFGIQTSAIPKCTGYVEPGKKKWVIGDEGVPPEDLGLPSVIAYPVRVELLPRPVLKVAAGPVSCTAPE